jgi:hypothetical protein
MSHSFCLSLLFLLGTTAASPATITIPIVSGTLQVPGSPFGVPPAFDLVTTTGAITGTTPSIAYDQWFSGAPLAANALLVYFSGSNFPTHLHLTVPAPLDIISDGAMGDWIAGQLTTPLLTLSPDQHTYVGFFSGQLEVQQLFQPDEYIFPGSGTVSVTTAIDSQSHGYIVSETFQFGAVPEPATCFSCIVGFCGAAVLLRLRPKRNHV